MSIISCVIVHSLMQAASRYVALLGSGDAKFERAKVSVLYHIKRQIGCKDYYLGPGAYQSFWCFGETSPSAQTLLHERRAGSTFRVGVSAIPSQSQAWEASSEKSTAPNLHSDVRYLRSERLSIFRLRQDSPVRSQLRSL